ncbi:MAG TPA: hypothetical protein VFY82_04790 [Acidimicrobiales bacterium]|nr:hypothetical protein [Acidimicrobiales bacterium]
MGATLIAASVVVLVIGMAWLNRSGPKEEHLASPTVDGVTLPTDSDGNAVDVPPSQPAVAVSFGGGGEILRPDPVRARVVDESGHEVIVPLAPNTTVDTVTGAIVPKSTTTTRRSGTTGTTRRTSTTDGTTAPTNPSTTANPPSTPTPTEPSTTTTEATTTTTEATTTTSEAPPPDPDPTLAGILDGLLP